MLYMKEMRPKIAAECTLKESAAINQILGKRVKFILLYPLPFRNWSLNFLNPGQKSQKCSIFVFDLPVLCEIIIHTFLTLY